MPHPYLLFCPYFPMSDPVAFADWELGPLKSFENRWMDPRFKAQATAFLGKFVGADGKPIENPVLLCRKGKQLDGQQPSLNRSEGASTLACFCVRRPQPKARPGEHARRMGDGDFRKTRSCTYGPLIWRRGTSPRVPAS